MSAFDNWPIFFSTVLDKMVRNISFLFYWLYQSDHIVKRRKSKRVIISRVEGWVGAYNRNSFLLIYRCGYIGGNVTKHFKLGLKLYALNYMRDFEQYTYLLHDQAISEGQ